jgi:hypothetical protein
VGSILDRPVIILSAPRSGTTPLARTIGLSDQVFLITEVARHLKQRNCPEGRSGLSDAELRRAHFCVAARQTAPVLFSIGRLPKSVLKDIAIGNH